MSTQPFLSTDPAYQLASALQAIDEAIKDFAEVKIEHKVRMERLYKEAGRLRMEILTGQKQLPLDGAGVDSAVKEFVDELQDMADRIGITTTISSGEHSATIKPHADV